ncbi:MAG: hypothetical protein JNL97_01040 [Verrucomicrobiales bacterium]|nr:hypothetical protein [Verrucomicrobiales bacterium]
MRTRAATVQLACFGATWAGVVYGTRWAPGSIGVLALGVGLALFLNVVVAVVVADRLARGRETAEAPRGEDCPRARAVPEQVAASWTWSRAFPFVLLLSASALGLPWRGYPVRSAVLFGALVAVVGIGVLRLRRQATGTVRAEGCESTVTSGTPGRRLGMRFAGVILGAAAIGGMVPFLFRPERTEMVAVLRGPGAGVGGGILLAALASMAFVAWYFRNRPGEPSPESLVDEVYEPLLREWQRGRSFDKRLKALVLERSRSVARRMAVGTGTGVEVRGSRAWIDAVRTEIAAPDAALRNHIGEKDFERFRRYERTVPERALVRRFARRMAGTRAALTAETEAALVRALEQARLEFPWSTAAGRREPSGAVLDLLSEEGEGRLATFEEEDSRFRAAFRRVAGGLLTPAGATAFCDFWDGERQIEIRALRDLSRGGSVCPLDSRGGFRLTSRT